MFYCPGRGRSRIGHVLHRSARLDASHYRSSCQMLLLKTYLRLRENPDLGQTSQNSPRQREPRMCKLSCFASIRVPHAERRGIGQPTARRIISFAHPAQHRYFRGSSIEIARLSPLRS